MTAKTLPNQYARLVSPADRKKLGITTAQDVLAKGEVKSEKELQKQIVSLLRLNGIEVNVSRMDKRKTDRVGWPDITFSISTIYFEGGVGMEIKFGKGQLSKGQQQMHVRLSTPPNSWRISVIRSIDQAIKELRFLGI